jgi:hypothetical protein
MKVKKKLNFLLCFWLPDGSQEYTSLAIPKIKNPNFILFLISIFLSGK